MDPPTTNTTAFKWHRSIFIATLFLLISFPHYTCGQETATLAEDATAPDTDIVGDVTDLGDVVGDAMADLTDLVEDLDSEVGADADVAVEDATEEEPAADTGSEEIAESAAATTAATDAETAGEAADDTSSQEEIAAPAVQSGPYIDLLGDSLLSLEMVDETHAQVNQHNTNEALSGKKVVGLYFSADWCGPCKQFTPDLVNFYNKMNARRGKQDQFEIVWISRCRTVDDFGQYFTQMNWLALPPNEAMGERGQMLGEKYKVQGIPSLVLLDEIGNVITLDGRNKIPMDKAGIGFPWRSPVSVLISALVPKSFRLLVKNQLAGVLGVVKGLLQRQ